MGSGAGLGSGRDERMQQLAGGVEPDYAVVIATRFGGGRTAGSDGARAADGDFQHRREAGKFGRHFERAIGGTPGGHVVAIGRAGGGDPSG